MKTFLVAAIVLLSASTAHAACPDVEQQFAAYKSALKSGSDVAQFFSRKYLEGLVNGFNGTTDEKVLLHEANRAKLLTHVAAVNAPGYTTKAQCNKGAATLIIEFPKGGDTNSVKFGYLYEDGAWRISELWLNINPTISASGI